MSDFFHLSAADTKALLPFDELIDALRQGFVDGCEVPLRHHHTMKIDGDPDATLLLMPAWNGQSLGGIKLVNVCPGNADRGAPALSASYLLFDTKSGRHLAMLDGGEITARRTVAASALAASYLSREDSETLLVVGGGRLGSNLPYVYREVRPIKKVIVWGRNPAKLETLVRQLNDDGFEATASSYLKTAVEEADIITCATLATDPLIKGEWLRDGQHVDLIKNGVLTRDGVKADLYDLCRGHHAGRQSHSEITLFKAVGTALEDLAASNPRLSKINWEGPRSVTGETPETSNRE